MVGANQLIFTLRLTRGPEPLSTARMSRRAANILDWHGLLCRESTALAAWLQSAYSTLAFKASVSAWLGSSIIALVISPKGSTRVIRSFRVKSGGNWDR